MLIIVLQELNQKARENQARDLILKESVGALTSSAISLYRLSIEKEKPNIEKPYWGKYFLEQGKTK